MNCVQYLHSVSDDDCGVGNVFYQSLKCISWMKRKAFAGSPTLIIHVWVAFTMIRYGTRIDMNEYKAFKVVLSCPVRREQYSLTP